MGEIADMMLDGTLCEMCGVYIGSNNGFPSYCSAECAKDRGAHHSQISEDDDFDIEHENEPSIENTKDFIDSAITWLEMAMEDLKELKIKHKANALKGFIKNLEQFKESIKEK